jgi:hypothetical protein
MPCGPLGSQKARVVVMSSILHSYAGEWCVCGGGVLRELGAMFRLQQLLGEGVTTWLL